MDILCLKAGCGIGGAATYVVEVELNSVADVACCCGIGDVIKSVLAYVDLVGCCCCVS